MILLNFFFTGPSYQIRPFSCYEEMKQTRTSLLLLLIFLNLSVGAQTARMALISPLASYSDEWNKPVYRDLNTARDSNYLTGMEKDLIWILNMIRQDPKLFLKTVVLNPKSEYYRKPEYRNNYFNSLVSDLQKQAPNKSPLRPDRSLFQSAFCHAMNSGKTGYVGHDRKWECNTRFAGECCSYGFDDALDIIMQLLIDDGVPSLGHRSICLNPEYDELGISIQQHSVYSYNAVLDFY